MGFRQADISTKLLAEALGLDQDTVAAAVKKSKIGGYARVWSAEDKGNYSMVKVSTRKKHDNNYETDFQDGFVRFIGSAHEKIKGITVSEKGVPIQFLSCEVTTPYNAETKKGYTNYAVFAFNVMDGNGNVVSAPTEATNKKASSKAKTKKEEPDEVDDDDDLPF